MAAASGSARTLRRLVLAPLVVAQLLAFDSADAAGPTFVVNSIADAPASANVFDGVCETAPGNGICTLRAAVEEANRVEGGGASIRLPAGIYYLSIAPTDSGHAEDGDLDLEAPMTIDGEGPSVTIVDGSDVDRIFFSAAAGVVIRDLTVRNGKPADGGSGGGIASWSPGGLTLENVVVRDNGPVFTGGGVYNQGTITLRHCVLEDNETNNSGGGLENNGGVAHVFDSLIQRNRGVYGAGLANSAQMTIERSLVFANVGSSVFGKGGGVYAQGFEASDELQIINSTIAQNKTDGDGGGVYAESGETRIYSSTITENVANANWDRFAGMLPPVGGRFGGGIGVDESAFVYLKNSIVSDNFSYFAERDNEDIRLPDECGPNAIVSGDYDWIRVRNACLLTGALTNVNDADADPELLGLAQNGGFTRSRAGTSFTVDRIPAASCTDPFGAPLALDQKGNERSRASYCDYGADERVSWYRLSAPAGVNLLRNGGAESEEIGVAATDSTPVDAPYWRQDVGTVGQVVYGAASFPTRAEAPSRSGSQFFSGGTAAISEASQEIDVSAMAAQITAGTTYRISGAFGGYGSEGDSATLTVYFSDAGNDPLDTVVLGGFGAADRGNETKLLLDVANGQVPIGTYSIYAALTVTRVDGSYNDGYADDLSIVLPETDGVPGGAVALLALASARRRRGR